MRKPKIAIMAVVNNIERDVIDRFVAGIRHSETRVPFDILLGRHENISEQFRKTTILNDILRQSIDIYPVIVQTDIDMLTPPHLLNTTIDYTSQGVLCYHCNYRYVEMNEVMEWMRGPYKSFPWGEIRKRKIFRASGSWNGMNSSTWMKSNGFCEEIYNLGGPDTEFYTRSSTIGVRWIQDNQIPLSHINHPRRSNIPKQGKINLQLAKAFPKDYNWLKNRKKDVCSTVIEKIGVNY